jgi:hypothetical protein
VSVEHVINVLARLNAARPANVETPLQVLTPPIADTARYDRLRDLSSIGRPVMRDVIAELKTLRLHGMAGTWADLMEQNNTELERSRWLVEGLLVFSAISDGTKS